MLKIEGKMAILEANGLFDYNLWLTETIAIAQRVNKKERKSKSVKPLLSGQLLFGSPEKNCQLQMYTLL